MSKEEEEKKDVVDFSEVSQDFKKEKKTMKVMLLAVVAYLVFSFLPWISVSAYLGHSYTLNSWHGSTIIGNLAAMALIVVWLLPKIGISLPIKKNQIELAYKAGTAVVAGFTLLFFFRIVGANDYGSSYNFADLLGIGFYVSLISSLVAAAFAFGFGEAILKAISGNKEVAKKVDAKKDEKSSEDKTEDKSE